MQLSQMHSLNLKDLWGPTRFNNLSTLDATLHYEDLSAEVLKKLKSYVKDEDVISGVVITVPADVRIQEDEPTK